MDLWAHGGKIPQGSLGYPTGVFNLAQLRVELCPKLEALNVPQLNSLAAWMSWKLVFTKRSKLEREGAWCKSA